MLDTLADVPTVGLALGVMSLALFGVVTELPSAAPPDAAAVGETVDRVAATPHPTTATHPLTATDVRLGPREVALRSDGGTSHATFAYGPVTPVADGKLARVLRGAPPARVFESSRAFAAATRRARARDPSWTGAGDRLLVRSVSWGEVYVTLVGA